MQIIIELETPGIEQEKEFVQELYILCKKHSFQVLQYEENINIEELNQEFWSSKL